MNETGERIGNGFWTLTRPREKQVIHFSYLEMRFGRQRQF